MLLYIVLAVLLLLCVIMACIRKLLKKLEVENEPGLSNGQLMLTNDDLRPGEIIEQTWLVSWP